MKKKILIFGFILNILVFIFGLVLLSHAGPIVMQLSNVAPSGAAGGILTGTYPNPSGLAQLDQVVTIDNTADPTFLIRKDGAGASVFSVNSSVDATRVHTGYLSIPNGTASAPGLRFGTDTLGGWFRPAADYWGYEWNNVERTRIWASGVSLTGSLFFGATAGTSDLALLRDAAQIFAQRNGVNAQTHRIYNTYTDASNYERADITWSANAFAINTVAAGTGTNRQLLLSAGSALGLGAGAVGETWRLDTSNHLFPLVDNTRNIGYGTFRVNTVFANRLNSVLTTPASLVNGDWWTECSGTSPTRTCTVNVYDGGATRILATMTY